MQRPGLGHWHWPDGGGGGLLGARRGGGQGVSPRPSSDYCAA